LSATCGHPDPSVYSRYYHGSSKDTIWNQDQYRRSLLESEQRSPTCTCQSGEQCIMSPTCHLPPDHAVLCARYLQQIENGTHKSLAMYPGFNNRDAFPAPSQRTSTPIGHWGREQWTDQRPKTPPAHVSALQHLRTFNTTLSAGLGNLRESLQSTNRGLDSCLSTYDARRSRPRPRSTMK